ncbi:MAG: hypothetical protein H0W33_08980 [Gammaproteobacteria bacterium]|nr:hypothetical protein [Gammaproteobacteria bacterium]
MSAQSAEADSTATAADASSGDAAASGGTPDSEAELAAARATLAEAQAALDAAVAAVEAGRQSAQEAEAAQSANQPEASAAGAQADAGDEQAGTPEQAQAAAAQASAEALAAAAEAYAKASARLEASGRTMAAAAPGRQGTPGGSQTGQQPGDGAQPGAKQPGEAAASSSGNALIVAGADLNAASVLLASASGNVSGRGGAQIIVLDQNLTEEMLLEGTARGAAGTTGTIIILPPDAGALQTGDERRAGLDRELKVSLATFDGKLIAEQERIRASSSGAPGRSGDSEELDEEQGDAATGNSTFGGPPPIQTGREPNPGARTSSGAGRVPGGAPSRTGSGSGTGPAQIPVDIPDGDDDDVVARQLREAAMNEADPELREKLWDEYRSYKQGTGR